MARWYRAGVETGEWRRKHRRLPGQKPLALIPQTRVFDYMSTSILEQLPIKIFADGADLEGIIDLYRKPFIQGLTTNPTLMRKVGISDYETFARSVLESVTEKPISFEVFSDEFPEMRRQALKIRDWQENVYVKIPITNTRGESALPLIGELAREGVKVNVTAILTLEQVRGVAGALEKEVPSVVSVFAGRIADTGVDPVPMMKEALEITSELPEAELLWASVREVLNVFQAAACGCHIVTVPHDILAKATKLGGMDLSALSLDTVQMFYQDAVSAGFRL
jgi:transaldolase